MTRPMVQQHMRVEVCRFCGCDRSECKEKCVSGTTELPIETLNELREQQTSQHAMKVRSRDVWKWPEWQEFAARLGIPLTRHVTGCVVHLDQADVVRVTITYIPWNVPCPTPPADTAPSASQQEHNAGTTHTPAANGDTQQSGAEQP